MDRRDAGEGPVLRGGAGREDGGMTCPPPLWGEHPGEFDRWVLRSAPSAVRVLLPLVDDDTGEPVTWRRALEVHRSTVELDGYVSWPRVAELPGDGGWTPPRRYRRACGLVPRQVCDVLVEVLGDGAPGPWSWQPDPVTAGSRVALGPPALSPVAPAVDAVATVGAGVHPAVVPAPLEDLAASWSTAGFSGHAWSSDLRVGVAAPPYADSLVVSGPVEVTTRLLGSGLEAHRVARHAPLPDVQD